MAVLKSTKSQIDMTETILILFVFIILLAIGLFFYYQFYFKSIERTAETTLSISTSFLLSYISSMPEISCNNEKCIDTLKLFAFINQNPDIPIFKGKKIEIKQLYPIPTISAQCTIQHYQQHNDYYLYCDSWLLSDDRPSSFKKAPIYSTPISLYYPNTNKYGIGKLIITDYLK